MKLRFLTLATLAAVAACSDSGNGPGAAPQGNTAVIAARAPDFSSGAVSLVDIETLAASNNHGATISDIRVVGGMDHYFLIERFQADRVLRYAANAPDTPVYAYSTQDADDDQSSNPSDLIVVSPTKGYLLRYGSDVLWIVNPAADTEADFKLGEIDLSHYDADGVPEMAAGLLHEGLLYVALQRLENFASVQAGYVAVIDTASDEEIDTLQGSDGLRGIELPVRSPEHLRRDGDTLLLSASGGFDGDFNPVYEGGIVRLGPADFSATLLVDDGNAEEHPFEQIVNLAVAGDGRAWFIGSDQSFGGLQSLFRLPADGGEPQAVTDFADVSLSTLAIGPRQRLWLGRAEDEAPGITLLDLSTTPATVAAERIDTELTPINIEFVTAP